MDLRRTLIPFVTKVLTHGATRSHRPTHDPVPIGAWRAYFAEDFEELGEVLAQGVVRALCYQAAGWETRDVLTGPETRLCHPERARLWEVTGELAFEYSDVSLRLCEALHNLALKPGAMDATMEKIRDDAASAIAGLDVGTADGDALVLYWMVVGLWNEFGPANPVRGARPHVQRVLSEAAMRQPLLMLRHGPSLPPEQVVVPADIEAMLAGPLRPVAPWLIDHALAGWRELERGLLSGPPATFVAARRRQATLMTAWSAAIERSGWTHLAIPFLETYRWQLDSLGGGSATSAAEVAVAKINEALRDQPQELRFEVRRAWAELLETADDFREVFRRATLVHPADREANHRWFVDWWARADMSRVVEDVCAVARRIEGRLG
jgi:hypothetical protein